MKHLKKTLIALILPFFFSSSLLAQTKIWGAGAPVGNVHGEFQQPFIQTVTNGNYSDTAWTALSVYDTDTITPGNAFWAQTLTGLSQGAYAPLTPISSPSQANGAAIFDSDYLDNAGNAGAFGTGTSPATHRGELISPLIDLSGYTDSSLTVKFFTLHRMLDSNELSVAISTDSGLTWSSSVDYTIHTESIGSRWVRVSFPNVTAGISNLSNCRIKFIFDGGYYYSILDDVTIETTANYDIAVAVSNPNATSLEEKGDFVKIGNNEYYACVNVQFDDFREWFYGLRAVNHGAQNLYPSDSARIRLSIDFIDDVTGLTTQAVYIDTLYFSDTLFAGAANSLTETEYLRDIYFIFIYGAGTFRAKYWLEHKHQDAYVDNDTVFHSFRITEYIPHYNYISKAALSSLDDKVAASSAFFPNDSSLQHFEIGSMYYFPTGGTNQVKIDSVDFRYYIPSNYTGTSSLSLSVNIYQFVDGYNGGIADGLLDPSHAELLFIGISLVQLTGLGSSKPLGSYQYASTSYFIDPSTGLDVPNLVDNGYYLVTIMQNPTLLIPQPQPVPPMTTLNSLHIGRYQTNQALNQAQTSAALVSPHPSVFFMEDTLGNSYSSWQELGFEQVPSIGIHTSGPGLIHSNNQLETTRINLELSPNPVQDILTIKTKLTVGSKAQYIITDALGRIIYFNTKNISTEDQQEIDVHKFPVGTYHVTVKTATQKLSQSFIKR